MCYYLNIQFQGQRVKKCVSLMQSQRKVSDDCSTFHSPFIYIQCVIMQVILLKLLQEIRRNKSFMRNSTNVRLVAIITFTEVRYCSHNSTVAFHFVLPALFIVSRQNDKAWL